MKKKKDTLEVEWSESSKKREVAIKNGMRPLFIEKKEGEPNVASFTSPSPTPHALLSVSPKKSSHLCHACQLGKHVRLSFTSSDSIVTRSFEIVHSDIWTSPIASSDGFKYYVLFLDHYSHYLWIYPLRTKSEVFQKFLHFRSYVNNQFKCDIAAFQCDHGGEFDNTNLLNLFAQNGIQVRFSCPKTSQQNGKSERMIRTINNVIRTLLFQAHLPPTFWVEALHMAAYLLNLLPSSAIQNEIPCTKLFNKQPDYSRLRIFGCLCYPHLHSPHKLAPRATPCIFLGYPAYHRGYRCLDLSTNKIIISRHVTFDELQFPYGSITPLQPTSYTFLDPTPSLIHQHIIHNTTQHPTTPHAPITPMVQYNPTPSPMHSVTPPSAHADTPPHHNTSQSTTQPNFSHTTPTSATTHTIPNPPTRTHLMSPSVALSDPNWRDAMYDEYNALIKNSTSVLVPKPPNVNVVRSMWLFRHKYHADGSLSRYKARLVANGRSQQFGVDCDDTFSHVVKPATIRTVMRTGLVSRRVIVTRPCSYINMVLRHVIISKEICFGAFGKANMDNCNPTRMSVDTESKLGSDRDPISDPTLYRSLAGGLQRFTSGYCVFLGDNLLSLSAKRQHTLYRSSAEAEYRGVANVVVETAWLHNLLKELHTPLLSATLFYCDNVRVLHVPSCYQYADIFTKELRPALFEEFLPDDAKEYILRIMEEECVVIPWKKGDVMLVNNMMVLHARKPLLKPPRKAIQVTESWLDSLLHRSGAVLFRGFNVFSASKFNDVVESSGYEDFSYGVGGAGSRTKVMGRVYTANEAPLIRAPIFPSKLFFFCEVEPGSGGETCIALSQFMRSDDPSSPVGRSWKETFMTDDKNIAEERAAKLGMRLEWMDGAVRITIGPKPGIKYDEARKRKIWFNECGALQWIRASDVLM
ncbi:ribonuclease H-like domain-containing protein [Tanacetum coccineum]